MSGRPGSRLTPVWWAGADAEPVLRVVRLGGSSGCAVPSDRAKASRGGGVARFACSPKKGSRTSCCSASSWSHRKRERREKYPENTPNSKQIPAIGVERNLNGRRADQRRQLLHAAKADGGIGSWSVVRELSSATESQLQRLKDLTRRWQAEPCTSASNHETRHS